MTPSAVLERDITIASDEHTDEPELCESNWCKDQGAGAHEAHYTAHLACPCWFTYLICQTRADGYRRQVRIGCPRCGGSSPVEEILIWPLKGGS